MNQDGTESEPELLKIDVEDNAEVHRTCLQEGLTTQWHNGQFCDLKIKYTDGFLDVHACVLFGLCARLIDCISLDCFNATSKELNLESYGITDCGIRPIVNYLYSGSLVVKNDQAVLFEVRKCAKLLGLKNIESICNRYAKDETDVEVKVSFANGFQTSTSDVERQPKRTTRKRGRPSKRKSSPKIIKKETCDGDSKTKRLCRNVKNGGGPIAGVKTENVSDEEWLPESGRKRRTRASNRTTVESIKTILKVEEDLLNFHQVQELDCDQSEFKCSNCSISFKSISEIENHLKSCTFIVEEPKIKCDICGQAFTRQCNLTIHKRRKHTERLYLQCTQCDMKANSESELRTHCKKEHGDFKPFSCDFPGCDYKARKFEFVHRHKQIHQEFFDHMCENCGRAFSQLGGLISHRRACYASREFLCDLCGKSFNHAQSMKTHRRAKHFNEKPYCCEVCNARFSDHRNFKRHKRIHENVYPYCCEICGKRYRHSNSLKAHMLKHTGSAPGEEGDGDHKYPRLCYGEVEQATASLVLPVLPPQQFVQDRVNYLPLSTGSTDLTAITSMMVTVHSTTSLDAASTESYKPT